MFHNTMDEPKESKIGGVIAYLYVIFPVFIFCVTWTKLVYAIFMGLILIISTFFALSNLPSLPSLISLCRKKSTLVLIIVIIGVWVYLSGIGGYVFQNSDHLVRNAIFNTLVENDWPVIREIVTEQGIMKNGLTYYIGFWLPAALLGKIFGLSAGYFFLYLWALIGILIAYYLICCILKNMRVWPLIVFIFFSGLDIIGNYATGKGGLFDFGWMHLELWAGYQYSSITTQLFWVFNQAIPAWVITFMLFLHTDNKNTLYLWSMGLLSCTFPFVGMFPLVLYFSVRNNNNQMLLKINNGRQHKRMSFYVIELIKSHITFQNIIGALCVAVIMLSYLTGNTAVKNTQVTSNGISLSLFLKWFEFVSLEVICYFILILKYKKRDPLYYIIFVWLMICPFIRVGSSIDFCMRASIPALMILYIMVVDSLKKALKEKNIIFVGIMVIVLCIGSVTGIFEINRTITYTESGDYTSRNAIDTDSLLSANNFSCGVESNLFFKYIAK